MLAGGLALCVAGLALGEARQVRLDAISVRSVLAALYLVFAGSIVAFSAYNWLLYASTPARVGTYAFVNPVVAVFLGWLFAGEAVGGRELAAGAVILASVGMLVFARHAPQKAEPLPETIGPYLRDKEAKEQPLPPSAPRLVDLRRAAP